MSDSDKQQDLDTFPKLLQHNATRFANVPSIREKEYGIWQTWTWAEAAEEIKAFANGLATHGFGRGDKLFIIGSNRPRMYWAMCAAQSLGGIPVPTYQDAVVEELTYVVDHAEVKYAIAEDQEQVDKLLQVNELGASIEMIIYDDSRGLGDYDAEYIFSFENIQASGVEFCNKSPTFFEDQIALGSGDDVAVLLYTSGTTGQPKGVILSHAGLIFGSERVATLESLTEKDSVMAYLPMAWVVDHFLCYTLAYCAAYCVCCPENQDTLLQDKKEIGPSFHFTSPRVLEAQRTDILTRMEDAAGIKRKLFNYFIDHASRVGISIHSGEKVSLIDRLLYFLGEIYAYGPLRNNLGYSKTRITWTAGEAIGPDMFDFYRSIGINLKQVYGQTEAGPFLTAHQSGGVRSDTVGVPLADVDVKIDEHGEVIFRSPGAFREYYKDPEATRKSKNADGWILTGDAGLFDHDGQLKIIDRIKDVGTMSNGSLFAPKFIENKLKFFAHILEVVTFGDQRDRVTALINIDLVAVGSWAERRNIAYASYQDLASRPEVYSMVQESIEQVNIDLSRDESLANSQITRFVILHKELDADDGELTRTRKVRRRIIHERYAELIEALYNPEISRIQVETDVVFEDGRKGIISGNLKIRDVKIFQTTQKTG
ncbi:MAG: AMP-binding protein [Proteobacteria bacterium]|nr:AMP-binding protein [Pseudomonadota bacterium]